MNLFLLLVVFNIFISSVSQVFLKKSSVEKHSSKLKEYLNYKVVFGYFLFFLAVLGNMIALKNDVLVKELVSLESLGYIFVPLLSFFFLKEKISSRKIVATCIIIIGLVVFYL